LLIKKPAEYPKGGNRKFRKISKLLKIDSMSKPNKNTVNSSNNIKASVTGTTTKLPGVDNTQVIPSSPDIIKENSYKVKKK
jgi:hypothetical protein